MKNKIIASWRSQKNQSKKSLPERDYDNFNCISLLPLSYPRQSLQRVTDPQRADSQFQAFLYLDYLKPHWNCAFPGLPSYQRLVEWIPSTVVPPAESVV